MVPFEAFLMSSGVTTDSRNIPADSIFFALKGERFNGNQYAIKALESGAKFAVVDEGSCQDTRIIKVSNVLESLQECARSYRRYLGIPIIGLTAVTGRPPTKNFSMQFLVKSIDFCNKREFQQPHWSSIILIKYSKK